MGVCESVMKLVAFSSDVIVDIHHLAVYQISTDWSDMCIDYARA